MYNWRYSQHCKCWGAGGISNETSFKIYGTLEFSNKESRIFSAETNNLIIVACSWTFPLNSLSYFTGVFSQKLLVMLHFSKCWSSSMSEQPGRGQVSPILLNWDLKLDLTLDILVRNRNNCLAWLIFANFDFKYGCILSFV